MSDKQSRPGLQGLFLNEQKKVMGAATAFSIGGILLIIQGSISIESGLALFGATMLAASIPAGIFSYIVALKMCGDDPVPFRAEKISEDLFTVTLGLSVGGFFQLLIDVAPVLAVSLGVSAFVSAYWFYRITKVWPVPERELDGSDKN